MTAATPRTAVGGAVAPPGPPAALLTLDAVSVEFPSPAGPVEVLREVSLTVHAGETVGLVGESGSGKSVTCLTATGLLRHVGGHLAGGRVGLGEHDMTRASESRWREVRGSSVAAVFQQPTRSLNPAYTVGDQVAEVLRTKQGLGRRAAWSAAVEMLDRVRIAHAAERARDYPHMLSGGMCQRVAIAIALAGRPRLLVADEPTTALDVTVQSEVLTLMAELQSQLGLGILYVSHDLSVVSEISDRVLVMYAGEVVEESPAGRLFAAPAHPYSRGLIRATPRLDARTRLEHVPGSVPQPGEHPEGCRFNPRCSLRIEDCLEGRIALAPVDEGRWARCVRTEDVLAGKT